MDLFLFPVPAQDILHCPITLQHLAASTHQVDRTNNFEKKSRQPPCNRQPSVNNSSTTSHIIKLSVSSTGLQLNVPMVAHSSLIEVPHLHQIHTQALAKNHNPSLTVCPHTPAPPSPHPQFLRFCKSQLTSPTHNPVIPLSHCFHRPIS